MVVLNFWFFTEHTHALNHTNNLFTPTNVGDRFIVWLFFSFFFIVRVTRSDEIYWWSILANFARYHAIYWNRFFCPSWKLLFHGYYSDDVSLHMHNDDVVWTSFITNARRRIFFSETITNFTLSTLFYYYYYLGRGVFIYFFIIFVTRCLSKVGGDTFFPVHRPARWSQDCDPTACVQMFVLPFYMHIDRFHVYINAYFNIFR